MHRRRRPHANLTRPPVNLTRPPVNLTRPPVNLSLPSPTSPPRGAAFIVVNVVSSAGWLGATNAEVSAKFAVPLTPAGWAFSIWGAIFLLEGYGAVLQAMGAGYDADGFKVSAFLFLAGKAQPLRRAGGGGGGGGGRRPAAPNSAGARCWL